MIRKIDKVEVRVKHIPLGKLKAENFSKKFIVIETAVMFKAFVEKYVIDTPERIKKVQRRVASQLINGKKTITAKNVSNEIFDNTKYQKNDILVKSDVRTEILIKQKNKNTVVESDEIEI